VKTKLWQTEDAVVDDKSAAVARFTTGSDKRFDLMLAPFDVQGSLAHAEMLCAVGLINNAEWKQLKEGLERIQSQIKDNSFAISEDVEDVHSQIELMLTEEIGDAAKKLHTGRSRNDQVLLDIKLYLRHHLADITARIKELFTLLQVLSEKHKEVLMPGYTHFQVAMPSSFGLWFGAYAESLTDDLELIEAAYRICNRNPLGSGAGYGSPFPLDREMTTSLLNFDGLNYNVVYAQMTRGKSEKSVATALAAVAATLSRLSYDVCLYLSQNFNFISFPKNLTTGSSIMPHKKNPDVFELVRARCNKIQSVPNELTMLLNNLPSGYHRDLQLTKEIIFPTIEDLGECLDMVTFMLENVQINDSILNDSKYAYLFTVEEVNKLVMSGTPFRDAYRQVAEAVESGEFVPDKNVHHSIAGGINNLCNGQIKERFDKIVGSITGAYTR
jgi:argininosuccinate lyase